MKELSKLEVWELAKQHGLENTHGGVDQFYAIYDFVKIIYKKAQEDFVRDLIKN